MADNQNEGEINFPPSLAVIWWPRSFPPRSLTSYKFHNLYLCIHREAIRWERNALQPLRSPFPSKVHNKNPFCSISFSVSWQGEIPQGMKLQLPMCRTNTSALIQLTWNVTDYSDEASDILPISSLPKGHISFLLAYITSQLPANPQILRNTNLSFLLFFFLLPFYPCIQEVI